jgi:hypothetical protein
VTHHIACTQTESHHADYSLSPYVADAQRTTAGTGAGRLPRRRAGRRRKRRCYHAGGGATGRPLAEADARFEDVEEYVALAVQAGEVLSTPTASRQDFHITHE